MRRIRFLLNLTIAGAFVLAATGAVTTASPRDGVLRTTSQPASIYYGLSCIYTSGYISYHSGSIAGLSIYGGSSSLIWPSVDAAITDTSMTLRLVNSANVVVSEKGFTVEGAGITSLTYNVTKATKLRAEIELTSEETLSCGDQIAGSLELYTVKDGQRFSELAIDQLRLSSGEGSGGVADKHVFTFSPLSVNKASEQARLHVGNASPDEMTVTLEIVDSANVTRATKKVTLDPGAMTTLSFDPTVTGLLVSTLTVEFAGLLCNGRVLTSFELTSTKTGSVRSKEVVDGRVHHHE